MKEIWKDIPNYERLYQEKSKLVVAIFGNMLVRKEEQYAINNTYNTKTFNSRRR